MPRARCAARCSGLHGRSRQVRAPRKPGPGPGSAMRRLQVPRLAPDFPPGFVLTELLGRRSPSREPIGRRRRPGGSARSVALAPRLRGGAALAFGGPAQPWRLRGGPRFQCELRPPPAVKSDQGEHCFFRVSHGVRPEASAERGHALRMRARSPRTEISHEGTMMAAEAAMAMTTAIMTMRQRRKR